MIKILSAGLLAASLLFAQGTYAEGIGFNATRVVIEKGAREGNLILNNSTSSAFLVQDTLETADFKPAQAGMVVPPLMRLLPGKAGRARIILTDTSSLPQDRETLFWLNSKAVPAKSKAENVLSLNYVNRLKVFYRPKELKGSLEEAVNDLIVSRKGANVTLKNNSPFYISLSNFKIDGKEVDTSDLIAPYSELTKTFKLPSKKVNFSWSALDEIGALITGSKVLG